MNGLTAKKIVEHMNNLHSLYYQKKMNFTDVTTYFIGYLSGLEEFNLIDKHEIKLFSDLSIKTLYEMDKKELETERPGIEFIIDNSELDKWYEELYKTVKAS